MKPTPRRKPAKSHNKRPPTRAIHKSGVKLRLWEDLYHRLLSTSWPRFIILLGTAYLGINIAFGAIYFFLGRQGLAGLQSKNAIDFFVECFFFSVQTFSTIGYGRISPTSLPDNVVVAVQALMGLISIGLMSGLFFSRFSRPTAKVKFSKVILVTEYMQQKALMFRLANTRFNQIVEASINVSLVADMHTPEGIEWRLLTDLNLIRQRTPLFALSWTVVHIIDEKSPLHGLTLEDLQRIRAQILVTVLGYDETFSQNVHARTSFTAEQFRFGQHFVDILHQNDTEIFVDIARISELRPLPEPPPA